MYQVICDNYHLRTKKDCYSDIYSGVLYQELVSSGFLLDKCNISLIFNTDGIPVFKSSAFAFWPLYLVINELPYTLRYVLNNIVCIINVISIYVCDIIMFSCVYNYIGSLKRTDYWLAFGTEVRSLT